MMPPLRAAALAALLALPALAEEKDQFLPTRLAFAPDAKSLAVVGTVEKKPALELWDVAARRRLWRVSLDAKTSAGLAWPDGKTLLVAAGPAVLEIDPSNGKTRRALAKHGEQVVAMALARDGKALATAADDRTVLVRDWRADRVIVKCAGDAGSVYRLAFSPDGGRLLAVNGKAALVWNAASGKRVSELKSSRFHTPAGLFRGKEVMIGSWDGVIRLYEGGEVKLRFHGPGGINALALHDGRHLLAASDSSGIAIIDVNPGPPDAVTAGRIKALLEKLDDESYETREAASRDLRALGFLAEEALRQAVQGSPSPEVRIRARVLRQALLEEHRPLNGHTGRVRDLCFAADGNTLASCADDGTVRLWSPATGKEIARLP